MAIDRHEISRKMARLLRGTLDKWDRLPFEKKVSYMEMDEKQRAAYRRKIKSDNVSVMWDSDD